MVKKKNPGLTRRQQAQLAVATIVFSGLLLLGGYWAWRSAAVPELVPLLNLPTHSPPTQAVAALAPSPTPIISTPLPTYSAPAPHIPLTQYPDGEREQPGPTTLPQPAATSGPSTVYFPNIIYFAPPTPPPALFVIAPPAPSWPDSLPGLTASKLSLHVLRNNDPDIMEFVRRAHPRVIKAVDDVGWLAEVKAASSATVTIGRFTGEQNADWPETLDPAQAAELYIAQFLEQYRLNPAVDYWEGWSDYQSDSETRWRWYAAFEAARVCQMRELGLRAAVGGFSASAPDADDVEWFMPALEAAHKCGGLFTLHEYNAPTLACGVNTGQTTTLRYRRWYDDYLKPAGLGDVPLVISELGIRGPSTRCGDPGNLGLGWKSYSGWWVSQGLGADGLQAYLAMLTWYDSEIRADAYVLGAAIFTAGAQGAEAGWQTFDVHDLLNPLTHYAVKQSPATEPAAGYP